MYNRFKYFKLSREALLLIFSYIFIIKPAHAYIDPGTTSIIISALIGLFVTISVYIRKYYNQIKKILYKILKIK